MNRDDVMNIFDNIIKTYNENNIGLKGMNLGFFSLYLNKLLNSQNKGIIVVTPTIYEANKLYQNHYNEKEDLLDWTFGKNGIEQLLPVSVYIFIKKCQLKCDNLQEVSSPFSNLCNNYSLELINQLFNQTIKKDEVTQPFCAEAEFRSHNEQYFLVRSAHIADLDSNEFVFFADCEELTEKLLSRLLYISSRQKEYLTILSSRFITNNNINDPIN